MSGDWPKYKDFRKGDARRCFAVLLATARLGERATTHYLAQDLLCTRAEVQRALVVAERQFGVKLRRQGSRYVIEGWGVLDTEALGVFISEPERAEKKAVRSSG